MNSADGLTIGVMVILGVVVGWTAAIVVAAVLVGARLLGARIPGWRAAMILAFVLVGSLRHPHLNGDLPPHLLAGSTRAEGVVDSLPVARSGGDRLVIRVTSVEVGGSWHAADARVLAYVAPDTRLSVSDRVAVAWTFTGIEAMPPGLRGFALSQGTVGSATVWSVRMLEEGASPRRWLVTVRRELSQRIQDLVPGDAGALISGIVTGDDSALSDSAKEAFARTGTGHITAVSGSNIAMLIALWSRAIRTRTRRHNIAAQIAIIGSIWVYCTVTGLEASALRASAVATLIILSGRFGRRADPLTVLALAAGVMLLWEPSLVRSVGFWLSVSASGALAGTFAVSGGDNWVDDFRASLAGLVAAQFATMPIVVWTFGEWAPIGILANLLLAPLMAVTFPVSFIFAAFSFVPVLANILAFPPRFLCQITLWVIDSLAPLLPMVQLASAGSIALTLIVLLCLPVVMLTNRDARRWFPRWMSRLETCPASAVAGFAGIAVGLAVAMLVMQVVG